jgi:hypothetical protein
MTQRIIFKNDDGGVSIIIPTPEALEQHGIQAIAIKDVPAGKPFKIVDASVIPSDRSQRDAWTVDEAELTDGVGADYGVGSRHAVVGWNDDGTPITKEVTQ